ncbi:DUF397 domain-containing protein [Actinosynnema pretiosum subsp. pretiosum]|uniref:DUF397 domain-containing protein n=1 Tax=Actinosynnema pretiosum subsp. pretiosum TaxID=103721 RepID=A0AA45L1H8_9PSEU|nr:hypothetical protein APASM_0387 [Actinosynnema pretiosum subsp. pretiosum]QUF01551.1 DUF397 domain-containing protein [Actinosynnema pretiosum subsp. pretiosum]
MIGKLEGAKWKKSRRSGSSGGNCVEMACGTSSARAIRDSKNPAHGALVLDGDTAARFLDGLKAGRFGR